jgi:hypothetical protein
MPRPKLKQEKQKIAHISINLTQEEKQKLQIIADKKGLSLSQLCLVALRDQKFL